MITTTQGTSFQLEMLQDAVNYHENGDADDAPCCTATAPCDTRKWVVGRIAELGGSDLVPVIETPAETPRPTSGGNQASTGARVQNPASDKQIAFINRLVGERDVTALTTYPARTLRQIQDGQEVSKTRASSLIDALQRAPRTQVQTGPAASDAQMAFLRTLAEEHGEEVRTSYTKAEASDEITRLVGLREAAPKGEIRTPARTQKVTEDGMYRTPDGEIYKVQVAVHGSGRLYAKKLVALDEPKVMKKGTKTHDFVFESGALAKLTPEMKMTMDEMKEWGKLYGTCCKCGLTLTDETSIAEGIGPVCGDRR